MKNFAPRPRSFVSMIKHTYHRDNRDRCYSDLCTLLSFIFVIRFLKPGIKLPWTRNHWMVLFKNNNEKKKKLETWTFFG